MDVSQRFGQLELVISQQLPIMDQLVAQNERHTAQMKLVISTATQQSDNISFLLREQSEMKADVAEMKTKVVRIEQKLDQILNLLGNRNQ